MTFPDQQPLDILVEPRGKTVVVHVAGELDLASKEKFEASLSDVASTKPEKVVLDLRGVLFIDSTGLSLVLEAWNQSRSAGSGFALLRPDGQVGRMLRETGLDQALPIVDGIPVSELTGSGRSGNGSIG